MLGGAFTIQIAWGLLAWEKCKEHGWPLRLRVAAKLWLASCSHTLTTYGVQGAKIPYKSHGGSLHARNAKNMAGNLGFGWRPRSG